MSMPLFKSIKSDLICYSLIELKYYFVYVDRIFSYSYDQVDAESISLINKGLIQISPYHFVDPKFVYSIFYKENPEVMLRNGIKLEVAMNLQLLSLKQNKFSCY